MALTVTRSGDWQSVYGHWRKSHVTIAFDSSYPASGESLVPGDFGLRVIDMILVEPKNGYNFEYDYTNSLIKVYKGQSMGVIKVDTSNVQNIATGEDDLIVYNMPASTLSQNGMGVRVTGYGTAANNSNVKILRNYFGSSSTGNAYLNISIAGNWKAVAEVIRTGATTQDTCLMVTSASTGSVSGVSGQGNVVTTVSTITETLTSIMQVRFTGTATTSGDIIQSGLVVEEFANGSGAGAAGIEVPNGTDLSGLTSVRVIAWGY